MYSTDATDTDYPDQTSNQSHNAEPLFDDMISIFEVKKAVNDAKFKKACGIDSIPTEVLKNDTMISVVHILLNICFSTGKIPSEWGQGVIYPIVKPGTTDPRDPLSYRGITLAPSMYKIYCYVLNSRLSAWSELNNKVED